MNKITKFSYECKSGEGNYGADVLYLRESQLERLNNFLGELKNEIRHTRESKNQTFEKIYKENLRETFDEFGHAEELDDLPVYDGCFGDEDLEDDPNVVRVSDVFEWKEYEKAYRFVRKAREKGLVPYLHPACEGQDCYIIVAAKQ